MKIHYVIGGGVEQSDKGMFSSLASVRYRVLIPATFLSKAGHQVEIIQLAADAPVESIIANMKLEGDSVAVISKMFSPAQYQLALGMKSRGVPIVVDYCDDNFAIANGVGEQELAVGRMADSIVSGSKFLGTTIERVLQRGYTVIADPFEGPYGAPAFSPDPEAVKLLWFGNYVNFSSLYIFFEQLKIYLQNSLANGEEPIRVKLHIVTGKQEEAIPRLQQQADVFGQHLSITFTPWSPDVTWRAIDGCDMVVLPINPDQRGLSKSTNRLLEPFRGGRMVVANQLPAYAPFADYAWIGDNLVEGILWACGNRDDVLKRITRGAELIERQYSASVIGGEWLKVFQNSLEHKMDG
ncbi:MAG: hypothetical protein HQL70_09035 [Magnetococcales bacterium]|nr:hypothetical protein [Magnetococcales bacterium]